MRTVWQSDAVRLQQQTRRRRRIAATKGARRPRGAALLLECPCNSLRQTRRRCWLQKAGETLDAFIMAHPRPQPLPTCDAVSAADHGQQ
jgi:hypothetical protein